MRRSTSIWIALAVLFSLMSCVAESYAQEITIDSTNNGVDPNRVFEPLVESGDIPTGLLRDMAISNLDLTHFDGTSGSSTVSLTTWNQISHDLSQSATDNSGPPSTDEISQRASSYLNNDVLPISVINSEISKIKPNPVDQGLLEMRNGQLHDISGPNHSPYELQSVFTVVPYEDQAYGLNLDFVIPSNLYFSNRVNPTEVFQVDFGDGSGFRTIQTDDVTTITYPESGDYTVHVKAYVEGEYHHARAELTVVNFTVTPDESWTDQEATRFYAGERATYDARIFYGKEDGTKRNEIKYPVVLVEPFDPNAVELDDLNLSDPAEERTWQDLYMLLEGDDQFATRLRQLGYDIVLLKLHNAAGYIQRNAFALTDLLDRLKDELSRDDQMVVIGPSMGGLVARYALGFLESRYIRHRVRLLATLDTPHAGANIPLGDQYFFEFYNKDSDPAERGKRAVNSVAARQMLVYHYRSFPGIHPMRYTLIDELNNYGYPVDNRIRKIAIANGRGDALAQRGNSRVNGRRMETGDKIVHLKGRSFGVDLDGYVYALPDRDDSKTTIFYGRKDVFGPHYRDQRIKVKNTLPYDNAPGGYRSTQQTIVSGNPDYVDELHTGFFNHDFIPIISALDLPTNNLFYNVSNDPDGLISENNGVKSTSIFDAIYYPSKNQEHVEATAENTNFLIEQIAYIAPTLHLNNMTISSYERPFKARKNITTGQSFTVKNGGDVKLRAGESITLGPGFKVKKGATFSADVNPELSDPPDVTANVKTFATSSESAVQAENTTISEQKEKAHKRKKKNASKSFALSQNYPNPFSSRTEIRFTIPEVTNVSLVVYNVLGQEVVRLIEGQLKAGRHHVGLKTIDMSNGTYFYRLRAGNFTRTRRMVVVR